MSGSVETSAAVAPGDQPALPRSRLHRLALAPVWFARERPVQTAAFLGLLVVLGIVVPLGVSEVRFRVHLRHARQAVSRGYNTAAIGYLEQCRVARPDHPEVLLLGARVARRTGVLESAGDLLDRYAELHGEDESLVLEQLLLRATRGEVEANLSLLLERVSRGGPDVPLVREALVSGFIHRFRWGEAAYYLDLWLKEEPDSTMAVLLRGRLQEQREDLSGAIAAYRRVLELDPAHDEARLRLAGMLLRVRDGEEAERHLRYLRTRLPNNPEVMVKFAQALALIGRTQEARDELDSCLQLYPNSGLALAERGTLAANADDLAGAERFLAQAVKLNPGDFPTRHQYALVLTRAGKAKEAAKEQESVKQLQADSERIKTLIEGPLQKRPNDPAVHHEIGMIALRAGQLDEALRWFDRALQVDPNHGPTHRMLAIIYEESGRPALAARHRVLAKGYH